MQAAAPRPSRRSRPLRIVAAALIVAILPALVGCGGDDDAGGEAAGTATTEATETTDPPTGSPTSEAGSGGASADLAAASGDAPAAAGAGLDEPPGEADRTPLDGFDEAALSITDVDGEVIGLCVLLALLENQRQQGLMEVTDLGGYDGMLFAFSEDTETGFWMSNTPMPLSIGWFAADGELVSTADMEPCPEGDDCPTYPPSGPYRFALEVPQGELPSFGVEPGSRMAVGGACA